MTTGTVMLRRKRKMYANTDRHRMPLNFNLVFWRWLGTSGPWRHLCWRQPATRGGSQRGDPDKSTNLLINCRLNVGTLTTTAFDKLVESSCLEKLGWWFQTDWRHNIRRCVCRYACSRRRWVRPATADKMARPPQFMNLVYIGSASFPKGVCTEPGFSQPHHFTASSLFSSSFISSPSCLLVSFKSLQRNPVYL